LNLYFKEKDMKKQITIILMILTILFSSCGTKKQITKSISENNITTQIDDSTQIKTSSKTITEIDDSIEITIEEQIEETITDTLKRQTTKRTTNRKTTISRAGNTITKQSENTDIKETTHKVIKEQKKEDNQSTTTINKTNPIRKYIIICFFILFLIYLNKRKK
jgi:hypothetical protein